MWLDIVSKEKEPALVQPGVRRKGFGFWGSWGHLGVLPKRNKIPFKGFKQSGLPDESSWTNS